MIDKYLPDYFINLTTITDARGNTRASTIATALASTAGVKVYRNRPPEGTEHPYIVIGDGFDFDYGQTAQENMTREIGHFNVCVCGRTYNSIDQLYRDVVDALKMVKNQYLPSADAAARIWVQCIILKPGYQFEAKPMDGSEVPFLGYCIPIRSGYDP